MRFLVSAYRVNPTCFVSGAYRVNPTCAIARIIDVGPGQALVRSLIPPPLAGEGGEDRKGPSRVGGECGKHFTPPRPSSLALAGRPSPCKGGIKKSPPRSLQEMRGRAGRNSRSSTDPRASTPRDIEACRCRFLLGHSVQIRTRPSCRKSAQPRSVPRAVFLRFAPRLPRWSPFVDCLSARTLHRFSAQALTRQPSDKAAGLPAVRGWCRAAAPEELAAWTCRGAAPHLRHPHSGHRSPPRI